jgi:hypothetical protein
MAALEKPEFFKILWNRKRKGICPQNVTGPALITLHPSRLIALCSLFLLSI